MYLKHVRCYNIDLVIVVEVPPATCRTSADNWRFSECKIDVLFTVRARLAFRHTARKNNNAIFFIVELIEKSSLYTIQRQAFVLEFFIWKVFGILFTRGHMGLLIVSCPPGFCLCLSWKNNLNIGIIT